MNRNRRSFACNIATAELLAILLALLGILC